MMATEDHNHDEHVQAAEAYLQQLTPEGDYTDVLDDLVHDAADVAASALTNAQPDGSCDVDIHDHASQAASRINNEGNAAQIAYLFAQGVTVEQLNTALVPATEPGL